MRRRRQETRPDEDKGPSRSVRRLSVVRSEIGVLTTVSWMRGIETSPKEVLKIMNWERGSEEERRVVPTPGRV